MTATTTAAAAAAVALILPLVLATCGHAKLTDDAEHINNYGSCPLKKGKENKYMWSYEWSFALRANPILQPNLLERARAIIVDVLGFVRELGVPAGREDQRQDQDHRRRRRRRRRRRCHRSCRCEAFALATTGLCPLRGLLVSFRFYEITKS